MIIPSDLHQLFVQTAAPPAALVNTAGGAEIPALRGTALLLPVLCSGEEAAPPAALQISGINFNEHYPDANH